MSAGGFKTIVYVLFMYRFERVIIEEEKKREINSCDGFSSVYNQHLVVEKNLYVLNTLVTVFNNDDIDVLVPTN